MKYHNITKDDMLNGDGLRVVLWVAGCSHHCPGCQNPLTWDPENGLLFDDSAKQEIFAQLDKEYISGITFSGGDPLYEGHREEVFALMQEIRKKYPQKDIWCYTGYTLEEIQTNPDFYAKATSLVDVLIEGRFEEALKDVSLEWRGSSNQRIIECREELV